MALVFVNHLPFGEIFSNQPRTVRAAISQVKSRIRGSQTHFIAPVIGRTTSAMRPVKPPIRGTNDSRCWFLRPLEIRSKFANIVSADIRLRTLATTHLADVQSPKLRKMATIVWDWRSTSARKNEPSPHSCVPLLAKHPDYTRNPWQLQVVRQAPDRLAVQYLDTSRPDRTGLRCLSSTRGLFMFADVGTLSGSSAA
jgi:hypothetical protein